MTNGGILIGFVVLGVMAIALGIAGLRQPHPRGRLVCVLVFLGAVVLVLGLGVVRWIDYWAGFPVTSD